MKRWLLIKLVLAGAGLLFLAPFLFSQPEMSTAGTASISGRVTIGKELARGILVAAQRQLQGESSVEEWTALQAYSDSEGSYLISGLKAGSYAVRPLAADFVNADDLYSFSAGKTRLEKTVHLAEGERVGGIDFSLTPGGVITGRITDPEGWPVAGKIVHLSARQGRGNIPLGRLMTDDRGIYRLFGVPPGRYLVGVGEPGSQGRPGGSNPLDPPLPLTYYPGVQDPAQAVPVEVSEGRETIGIDFKAPRFLQGFRVSGFMLEAESGQPVPNQRLLISRLDERGRRRGPPAYPTAGGNGEFEQGNLLPGKYELSLGPSREASYSADPVLFEISDQDVSGLILRLRKGDAAISGQVILEGIEPAEAPARLRSLQLVVQILQNRAGMSREAALAPDGSFSLEGLPRGEAFFSLDSKDFTLARYEFNGPPGNYLMEGFPLESGQQITGLKLYFVEGKGTLIGQVRARSGPLPQGMKCAISLDIENDPFAMFGGETDAGGRFRFENLPPGELVLHVNPSNPRSAPDAPKSPVFEEITQRVTIRPRQETQVEIVVDFDAVK